MVLCCMPLAQFFQKKIKNRSLIFLTTQPNARLVSLRNNENTVNPGRQILPGEENMDGFYYGKIAKDKMSNPMKNNHSWCWSGRRYVSRKPGR